MENISTNNILKEGLANKLEKRQSMPDSISETLGRQVKKVRLNASVDDHEQASKSVCAGCAQKEDAITTLKILGNKKDAKILDLKVRCSSEIYLRKSLGEVQTELMKTREEVTEKDKEISRLNEKEKLMTHRLAEKDKEMKEMENRTKEQAAANDREIKDTKARMKTEMKHWFTKGENSFHDILERIVGDENSTHTSDPVCKQLEQPPAAGNNADITQNNETTLTNVTPVVVDNLREDGLSHEVVSTDISKTETTSNNETQPPSRDASAFDMVLEKFVQMNRKDGLINWNNMLPDLSTYRTVCKSWKQSVDSLTGDEKYHVPLCPSEILDILNYKTYHSPCSVIIGTYPADINHDSKKVHQAIPKISHKDSPSSDYNPLPGRSVVIYLSPPPNGSISRKSFGSSKWKKIVDDLLEFLKLFGRQIFYYTFKIHIGADQGGLHETTTMFKYLCEWLLLLPNLRSLVIHTVWEDKKDWTNTFKFEELKKPCPFFEHLVSFQVVGDNFFVRALMKNNTHISKLHMGDFKEMKWIVETDFPNIAELSIATEETGTLIDLSNASWRPETLAVSVLTVKRRNRSEMTKYIIKLLTTFNNSLKSLRLYLPYFSDNINNIKVNLTNLKKLHLTIKEWKGGANDIQGNMLEKVTYVVKRWEYKWLPSPSDMDKVIPQNKAFGQAFKKFYSEAYFQNLPQLKYVNLLVNIYGVTDEIPIKEEVKSFNRVGKSRIRLKTTKTFIKS